MYDTDYSLIQHRSQRSLVINGDFSDVRVVAERDLSTEDDPGAPLRRSPSCIYYTPDFSEDAISPFTRPYSDIIFENTLQYPEPQAGNESIWFQDANCEISQENTYDITNPPTWFHDEVITTVFSILSRKFATKSHNIALLNPWMSNALYKFSRQQTSEPPEKDIVTLCTTNEFIFVPINDGFKSQYEAGMRAESQSDELGGSFSTMQQEHGSHWALLIVDCSGPGYVEGTYYDSFKDHAYGACPEIAKAVLCAVDSVQIHASTPGQRLERHEPKLYTDYNAPVQSVHNYSASTDGSGACGSFIFAMTEMWVTCILNARARDPEEPILFALPDAFPQLWDWDSLGTRRQILALIQRERRVRMLLNNGNVEWFDRQGVKGWKSWLRDQGLDEDFWWDPAVHGSLQNLE